MNSQVYHLYSWAAAGEVDIVALSNGVSLMEHLREISDNLALLNDGFMSMKREVTAALNQTSKRVDLLGEDVEEVHYTVVEILAGVATSLSQTIDTQQRLSSGLLEIARFTLLLTAASR